MRELLDYDVLIVIPSEVIAIAVIINELVIAIESVQFALLLSDGIELPLELKDDLDLAKIGAFQHRLENELHPLLLHLGDAAGQADALSRLDQLVLFKVAGEADPALSQEVDWVQIYLILFICI